MIKILYEQATPIAGANLTIGQMTPEYFRLCIERAFGDFPVTLNNTHIDVLRGMAACWAETAENPYKQLILAIKRLGSIRVFVDYGNVHNGRLADMGLGEPQETKE